jgi:type 1 glutamine amidotransferase
MRGRNSACLAILFAGRLALAGGSSPATTDLSRFFKPGALRVLILSGRNNHDWRTTTPFLRKLLTDSGRFDARVCEEPAGLTSETLAAYDALVVDYCGPRWGPSTEKAVESFVRSGKGMVVVHGASYAFAGLEVLGDGHVRTGIKESPWPEYAHMVGGYWPEPPPKQFHGQRHSFDVRIVKKDHPIVQGMKETFVATDELYHQMTWLPEAQVLATAFDDPKTGGTGKDEPLLSVVEYGKGRVFYIALGHEVPAMSEVGFITTFVRGTEWAASGRVSLPPDLGEQKPPSNPLRVLVVTGGHDYEPSFYTVFEGYSDLAWTHAVSNQEAFKNDLRKKFDVLVLYDFSQDLDEKGHKNLQDFMESGKGLVVLHHAIADYQSWPWWYQEVVGGRYLLKAEGGKPASTYKHDEELFVRPIGNHPITAGIGPMHIRDETYKGMWISPGNTIILRTDNPTSDGPIAWISSYSKSRVVYVELGHDSAAHRNSAYRTLVRNSILWSAGRKI